MQYEAIPRSLTVTYQVRIPQLFDPSVITRTAITIIHHVAKGLRGYENTDAK